MWAYRPVPYIRYIPSLSAKQTSLKLRLYVLYTAHAVYRPSVCQDLKFKTSFPYCAGEVG